MDGHLDEKALAARWPVAKRTLQRWRQEGKGPAFLKLGSRVVYRLVDVEAWEREHRFVSTDNVTPATADED